MNAQDRNELHQLLATLLDGSPDEQQQQRLSELLRDEEARRLYLEYFDLHADLALCDEHRTAAIASDLDPAAPTPHNAAARGALARWTAASLALVGLALVGILAILVYWPGSSRSRTTEAERVAELIASENAEWSNESSSLRGGRSLIPGTLQLRNGNAVVRMECGAEVCLRGPARLELIDAKAVRLLAGAVTVNAPDSAVGFRVLTPTADVVDLGTEFSIAVEDDGATEVHVARGVVVARSTGSEAVIPILRGEAGRIDVEQGDIVSTRFDADLFSETNAAEQATRPPRAEKYAPLAAGARILFLGDRVTDRETHLLLIIQALAGLPREARPKLFNQGVSFPLLFEEHHFQEHVNMFRPTHAVLEFGSDLAMNTGRHLLSERQFQQAVDRLIQRLEEEGIEPIIATGFPLHEKFAQTQPLLDKYNAHLRRLARERGYRLADVERRFEQAGRQSALLAANGRWPTFEGHRQIARELLRVWGYPEIDVDSTLKLAPLPGVISTWRYRYKTSDERLDDAAVAKLTPDDSWKTLELPLSADKFARRLADRTHSITYRDRARGFATNLQRDGSHGIEAVATIRSQDDRIAFLNTGATLYNVWINGEKVHAVRGWTGWHAGKQRIPVQLKKGDNRIVIEAGSSFFVSITDERDWPLP